jgi:hypothetical protein
MKIVAKQYKIGECPLFFCDDDSCICYEECLKEFQCLVQKDSKCLTCSNVADSCTPEDGLCNDKPERDLSFPAKERAEK